MTDQADQPLRSGGDARHLDASGTRDVVYCHQCDNEWYQDEQGLICPRCESEITEIITPENDPRPDHESPPSDVPDLHNHNPWTDSDISDPEEADIEEHITRGPGGTIFFSQTYRSSAPRGAFRNRSRRDPMPQNDAENVVRNFQNLIGTLMGPNFRPGQPGRSGPDTLFPHDNFGGSFRLGGNGLGAGPGPAVVGGRFTYTSGRFRPRDSDGPRSDGPAVDDLATLIGNIFGQRPFGIVGDGSPDGRGGLPPDIQGLFASLFNPDNAVHGDVVYSQEALDRIMTTLMEQHPTSNAPGPASPDAIAALPKKRLDEKLLGPEGKGECSVCMDDVHMGDEVVMLPCSHWFHETCAGAWLGEHNTCPICRKGIEGETPPASSRASTQSGSATRHEHRARRLSIPRARASRDNTTARNEARLESIRSSGRLTPTEETASPQRWPQLPGYGHVSHSGRPDLDYTRDILPGSYRRRNSELSDNQRESRRRTTSGSDRSGSQSRDGGCNGGGNGGGNGGNGGNNGGGGGGGPVAWLRNHFSGSSSRRHD